MPIRLPLVAIAFAFVLGSATAQTPADVWEGELRRGDVATPIRVTFHEGGDATLDLPALIYAEEPLPLRRAEDTRPVVTLPFGLGDFTLTASGDTLSAERGPFALALHRGAPAPYTRQTIEIPIEGGVYVGELYTPDDLSRRRGAIVVAGGASARGERLGWNTRSWCDFYARQGLHCLAYPRRNDVNGEGAAASMVQDVADLRAAVALLAARPGVDRRKLGVFGASRGVWLAVTAAHEDPRIRFLILSAPPATTPAEQEWSSIEHRMRAAGQPEANVAAARAYMRLYFEVARTGENWETLNAAARAAENEPWGEFVDQPLSFEDLAWYHANGHFDASAAYRALRIPVYAYWGGRDDIVPPAYHRPRLEALMAHNRRVATAVFAEGDHRGEQPVGFDDRQRWRWFGMAPGLLDGITAWLAERRITRR